MTTTTRCDACGDAAPDSDDTDLWERWTFARVPEGDGTFDEFVFCPTCVVKEDPA